MPEVEGQGAMDPPEFSRKKKGKMQKDNTVGLRVLTCIPNQEMIFFQKVTVHKDPKSSS